MILVFFIIFCDVNSNQIRLQECFFLDATLSMILIGENNASQIVDVGKRKQTLLWFRPDNSSQDSFQKKFRKNDSHKEK